MPGTKRTLSLRREEVRLLCRTRGWEVAPRRGYPNVQGYRSRYGNNLAFAWVLALAYRMQTQDITRFAVTSDDRYLAVGHNLEVRCVAFVRASLKVWLGVGAYL